jgi:flagellin
MAMRINTNFTAVTANRNLNTAQRRMQTSVERLSSGLRINHAQDDPAGLAIAEKIRTQVRGLTRASMNAQDGISLLQTAEAALAEVQNMLQRIRELSIQAANGTLTSQDRVQIQREVDQLLEEIDRASIATEFNTKKLLDGTGSALVSADTNKLIPIITGDTVAEGNYRLESQMTPGEGVVMKSDIFRVVQGEQYEFGNRGLAKDITSTLTGAGDRLDASDFTLWQDIEYSVAPDDDTVPGSPNTEPDFEVEYATAAATNLMAAGDYGVIDYNLGGIYNGFTIAGAVAAPDAVTKEAPYISLEVTSVRGATAAAQATVQDDKMIIDGTNFGANEQLVGVRITAYNRDGTLLTQEDIELDSVEWTAATNVIDFGNDTDLDRYAGLTFTMGSDGDAVTVGDKILTLIDPAAQYTGGVLQVAQEGISQTSANSDDGNRALTVPVNLGDPTEEMNRVGARVDVTDTAASLAGSTTKLSLAWLDPDGEVHIGTGDFRASDPTATTAAGTVEFNLFESTLAERVTELTWVDRFQEGISLFDTGSQTITVYVGNRRGDLVLQPATTLEEVADKLSRLMATSEEMGGLGFGVDGDFSAAGVDGNIANFVTAPTIGTDEAIAGTLVFRSPVPGPNGRIWFSGNDQLIDGFSWAEVKSATQNTLSVTVFDAHTSRLVGRQEVNDSVLRSIIDGVDVKVEQSADVRVTWDASRKEFTYSSDFGKEVSHLHVVDNPLSLQLGANPGQSLEVRIGSVTREGLQLDDLLVVSKEAAEEAVQKIDSAVVEVAENRARIGAYINRLNSTINIIDITQENLMASESRIRDLDMAKQTVEFTRDQVLVQAATAVLAQANVLPQSVLQLLQ